MPGPVIRLVALATKRPTPNDFSLLRFALMYARQILNRVRTFPNTTKDGYKFPENNNNKNKQ